MCHPSTQIRGPHKGVIDSSIEFSIHLSVIPSPRRNSIATM
jgi:hypothetical protein